MNIVYTITYFYKRVNKKSFNRNRSKLYNYPLNNCEYCKKEEFSNIIDVQRVIYKNNQQTQKSRKQLTKVRLGMEWLKNF